MNTPILKVLEGWNAEDLGNLKKLLGLYESASLSTIEDRFKWLYHSRAKAGLESAGRNLLAKIFQKTTKTVDSHSIREAPSYEALLYGACDHLKAGEKGASLREHELYLSLAVIVSALNRMKSRQRVEFFSQKVDPLAVAQGANIKGIDLTGPATTFAVLGAAQASGFGVYFAATTALGFLTHAVGVTLPFLVFSGLTSSIAFLIGPVGWLSAGVWGAWKLTQTEWKTLIPALVYIIARNARDGKTT